MKKINAEIIADSISPQGHRITTMLLTYPRFIHGEIMTHRMFSRNSASSRAIPFEKMVKMIEEDIFIPIAWQSKHSGMQGYDYLTGDSEIKLLENKWLESRDLAVQQAKLLNNSNVTKQLCSRLLEPFMWHTTLVTFTEINNFFELRCPKIYHAANGKYYKSLKDWNNVDKDIQWNGLTCMHPENKSQAEIHIQALAEDIWDKMNESTPKKLDSGEWHISFNDKFNEPFTVTSENDKIKVTWIPIPGFDKNAEEWLNSQKLKVSTARCARLSYMTFDNEIDYEKDIQLHNKLLEDNHFSPFEHCARAMSSDEYKLFVKGRLYDEGCEAHKYESGYSQELWISNEIQGWCNNFKGFIPYRYLIENNYK